MSCRMAMFAYLHKLGGEVAHPPHAIHIATPVNNRVLERRIQGELHATYYFRKSGSRVEEE